MEKGISHVVPVLEDKNEGPVLEAGGNSAMDVQLWEACQVTLPWALLLNTWLKHCLAPEKSRVVGLHEDSSVWEDALTTEVLWTLLYTSYRWWGMAVLFGVEHALGGKVYKAYAAATAPMAQWLLTVDRQLTGTVGLEAALMAPLRFMEQHTFQSKPAIEGANESKKKIPLMQTWIKALINAVPIPDTAAPAAWQAWRMAVSSSEVLSQRLKLALSDEGIQTGILAMRAHYRTHYVPITDLLKPLTDSIQSIPDVLKGLQTGSDYRSLTWPLAGPQAGWTLFHYVAHRSTVACIKAIFSVCDIHPDLDERLSALPAPEGWVPTTLTHAFIAGIQQGAVDIVERCIRWGADVGTVSNTGKHALHRAAEAGSVLLVKKLLPHCPLERGSFLWDPLHRALLAPATVPLADVHAIVNALLEAGVSVVEADHRGETSLHYAAKRGDPLLIGQLLAAGATPKVKNEKGETPLHIAAQKGHLAVYRRLLYAGADLYATDQQGQTPLQCAPPGYRGDIEVLHRQWIQVLQEKERLLPLLQSNVNAENLAAYQNTIEALGESTMQYLLAEQLVKQRQWEEAQRWANYAAEQGHARSKGLRQLIIRRLRQAKAYEDVLRKGESPPLFDPLTQRYRLMEGLGSGMISAPLMAYHYELRRLLTTLPVVLHCKGSVLQRLSALLRGLSINESLELGHEPEDPSLWNHTLVGCVKQYRHQPPTDPLGQALWQAYQRLSTRKTAWLWDTQKQQPRPLGLYTVLWPWLIGHLGAVRHACQPLVQRGTQWLSFVQVLTKIWQHLMTEGENRLHRHHYGLPPVRPTLSCALTSTGYLKPAVANKLIPEQGDVQRDNEHGTHTVVVIHGVHYKKLDGTQASPGIEYAINALNTQIANTGSAPTALVKVRRGKRQHSYQAAHTIPGIDMLGLLETHGEALEQLDPYHFSAQCVLNMLTRPRDGKPDNFIGHLTVKEPGKLDTLRLIGIDNDLAFGQPLFRTPAGYHTQVRTFVFLLPAMDKAIDPSYRDYFLGLDPVTVCLQWLHTLHTQNMCYEGLLADGLFTLEEFSGDSHALDDSGFQLPIQLPQGTVTNLYEGLCRAQAHLRAHPESTHHGLLLATEPLLGHLYGTLRRDIVLKEAGDPGEAVLNALEKVWHSTLCDSLLSAIPDVILGTVPEYASYRRAHPPTEPLWASADALVASLEPAGSYGTRLTQLPAMLPFLKHLTVHHHASLTPTVLHGLVAAFPMLTEVTLRGLCPWDSAAIQALTQAHPAIRYHFVHSPCAFSVEALTALLQTKTKGVVLLVEDVCLPLGGAVTSLLWGSLTQGVTYKPWYEALIQAGADLTVAHEGETPLRYSQRQDGPSWEALGELIQDVVSRRHSSPQRQGLWQHGSSEVCPKGRPPSSGFLGINHH